MSFRAFVDNADFLSYPYALLSPTQYRVGEARGARVAMINSVAVHGGLGSSPGSRIGRCGGDTQAMMIFRS
jgi:hypothetical protein